MTYLRRASLSVGELGDTSGVWDLIQPDRNTVERLCRESVRRGLWYRVLEIRERRYMSVLLRVSWRRIRSPMVLRILAPIMKKLLRALGRLFKASSPIECEGSLDEEAVKGALSLVGEASYGIVRNVARSISKIAEEWGNKLARRWSEDEGFIRYLAVVSMPQNMNPHTFTIRF